MHHVEYIEEIGAHNVHLVDVDHTGDIIVVGLSPYRFGLRLDSALGTKHGHAAVQHSERALDLHGKVNVSRSVDDVDTGVLPMTGGGGGGDGDASLLLLLHPVHGRGTLMGLTYFVVYAGVVQNTFCRRSLSGVDVSHDSDISGFFK